MRSRGFAPIAGASAQVLILGSLPGRESLRRREYYAQPRNAFWTIMGALCGAGPELGYAERRRRLIAARVALWDVCAAARRPGSLDSAIVASSVLVNDFAAFFRTHPAILRVCFNGVTAAALYRRRVVPRLPEALRGLPLSLLPSTSPAHAALSPTAKLARWSAVLGMLGNEPDSRVERPIRGATAAQ